MPEVDRTPPYQQAAEHYRKAIQTGQLSAGDELPSTRRLAAEWGIATSTAQRVLELLRAEGWIESRPGRPPVVAARPREDD